MTQLLALSTTLKKLKVIQTGPTNLYASLIPSQERILEEFFRLDQMYAVMFPSQETIAKAVGLKKRQVNTLIKRLVLSGYLTAKQRYDKSSIYGLTALSRAKSSYRFPLRLLMTKYCVLSVSRLFRILTSTIATVYRYCRRKMNFTKAQLAQLAKYDIEILKRAYEIYKGYKTEPREGAYNLLLGLCRNFSNVHDGKTNIQLGYKVAEVVMEDHEKAETLRKSGFFNSSARLKRTQPLKRDGRGKYAQSWNDDKLKERNKSIYNHNHSPLVVGETAVQLRLRERNRSNMLPPEQNKFLQMFPVPKHIQE